jgi:hypothetical protein
MFLTLKMLENVKHIEITDLDLIDFPIVSFFNEKGCNAPYKPVQFSSCLYRSKNV